MLLWIQQLQIVDTITDIEYKGHVTNVLDATIEENELNCSSQISPSSLRNKGIHHLYK